ncbi:MAG: ABC transporter permease, partial [Pseudomonadota bacterium]|nr:ABC transporter permease [Pseudomonadota bacterium]
GGGWLVPVGIMLAVVLAACLVDFLEDFVGLRARALLPLQPGRRWWPPVLLVAGLGLSMLVDSLLALFLAVALVFMAVGLWLPGLIGAFAEARARRSPDPLGRWRYRELSVLARRLALPLVALQFAMAMVLAVQALVTTFESTFDRWLAQRLAADYYIEVPPRADIDRAGAWLAERIPEAGGQWHRVIRGKATLAGDMEKAGSRVDLLAIGPVGPLVTDWRLLASAGSPWQRLAAGDGLMVNEQLARRQALDIGQTLTVVLADHTLKLPVLAIYPDYGRPAGELLLSAALLPGEFRPTFRSLSVSPGALSIDQVTSQLREIWQQEPLSVRDNRSVRALATTIFDQTFLLTRAMTLLTLLLAATALLLMGWVFFSTRAGYFRLLVVWGLSRGQAARQLTRLSMTLTGLVALLALPLGVWLTWVLVHRINPLAFGWSLPMAVYPGFWLELGVLSQVIGLSIAWLMRRQLRHGAPAPSRANALTGGER